MFHTFVSSTTQEYTRLKRLLAGAKIKECGWKKFPHLAFSPDLAPTAYSPFRSLRNYLSGKTMQNENDMRRTVTQFFAPKPVGSFSGDSTTC